MPEIPYIRMFIPSSDGSTDFTKPLTFIGNTSPKFVHRNESSDCAIVAASVVTGHSYEHIHSIAKNHGRVNKTGTTMSALFRMYADIGLTDVFLTSEFEISESLLSTMRDLSSMMKFKRRANITLKKFLEKNSSGKYVCLIQNHALAVIEGKLVDFSPRQSDVKITAFFRSP